MLAAQSLPLKPVSSFRRRRASTVSSFNTLIAASPRSPARCWPIGKGPQAGNAGQGLEHGTPVPLGPSPKVPSGPLRTLFPALQPHGQGFLQVSPLHQVYYQVFGNPSGAPALFLHGGPGAGCFPNHARFFDLQHYRVVLLDQRGCGRSIPRACLQDNTSHSLVADLELLREQLLIPRWTVVLGGSWGATLALLYAQAHPASVGALILRGVCLMRTRDINWLYRQNGGLDSLMPMAWERFLAELSQEERADPVAAYYKLLTAPDTATRERAAGAWSRLEMAAMFGGPRSAAPSGAGGAHSVLVWDGQRYLQDGVPVVSPTTAPPQPQLAPRTPNGAPTGPAAAGPVPVLPAAAASAAEVEADTERAVQMSATAVQSRIECHYAVHGAFLREGQILTDVPRVRTIPTRIVHGQWDLVCPLKNAFDLHYAWPEAELCIVMGAGHSMYDPGILHELILATESLKHTHIS